MFKLSKNTTILRTMSLSRFSTDSSGGKGSIRGAGGKLGEQAYAREEEYFRRKQKEQLENIKSHLHDEIGHYEDMIKKHQEQIDKAKAKIHELDKSHK